MKNTEQIALEILAAARAACPGVRVTAASVLASASIPPCVFIHAHRDDGRAVCGMGPDFPEAALDLWRRVHAPEQVTDPEKIIEKSS
jgi:hypothetical protein